MGTISETLLDGLEMDQFSLKAVLYVVSGHTALAMSNHCRVTMLPALYLLRLQAGWPAILIRRMGDRIAEATVWLNLMAL